MSRLRQHFTTVRLLLFLGGACLFALPSPAQATQPYLIGRGISDITGPLVGVPLWGFGRPDQIGEGLHIRLRSRAFVIAQADEPGKRLVFVSVDLGSIDHHMTLEVLERVQQRFGRQYTLADIIISATHTHSGPGGYWQSRTATGLDGGLYPNHFDAIATGITDSIVKAHEDLQPGEILINSGRVTNAGANRSLVAYLENPEQERARYRDNTNTQMTLLKFVDDSGEIGMLNWYALHPTAMNFYNHLVSGDHKGYASLQVERDRGTRYDSAEDFVAAFAQADPGDVTPNTNLDNTGPGETDVETTRIMGQRQVDVALELFASAEERLIGPIETRQIYIDMSNYAVKDRFTGNGLQHTCPSAYGYSFAGGSTEDGGGHFLFREGMTKQQLWRDWLIRLVTGAPKWTDAVKTCQEPKPVLFETGSGNPPLQSQIHSITLARVGQLVILAIPVEVTTMAGRRLRDTVMTELGDWAGHIVLAGYANGYSGYVTTPEEYMLQQYEAGHTLHGRWTLSAYQQLASQVATALQSGAPLVSDLSYDDWRGKSEGRPLPAGNSNSPAIDPRAGEVIGAARASYQPGETVVVEFRSTNPTAHFPLLVKHLIVKQETSTGWQPIADDGDWTTRVRWREDRGATVARLSWDIPADTSPGSYRLTHRGIDPSGRHFGGTSRTFEVGAL